MPNSNSQATEKDKEMKELIKSLENGVKDVFTSNNFKEYLNAMSKFHNYSIYNTMLIYNQNKDSTYIAGYNKWKELGRQVNKGEKAIKILAPMLHKKVIEKPKLDPKTNKPIILNGAPQKEKVIETWTSFKLVNVFDISQTKGKELPSIAKELQGRVDNYELLKNSLIDISDVPIEFTEINGTSKGYYDLLSKEIKIKKDMSEKQTLKTLIHELSHSKLHNEKYERRNAEVEAESIAYIVSKHFNIDTSSYSFGYIASWSSDKEIKELKASLDTIITTSNEIISSLEKNLQKELKPKKLIDILENAKAKIPEQNHNNYNFIKER